MTVHLHRPARFLLLALLTLGLAACGPGQSTATNREVAQGRLVTVHKSPTCSCCEEHEAHLRHEGFATRTEVHDDIGAWKEAQGIPRELGSCHTSTVGGYLIEGHVPGDTIVRLLDEEPAIDGVALPGMPAGSPGMGGEQQEPWIIQSFTDGEAGDVFDIR